MFQRLLLFVVAALLCPYRVAAADAGPTYLEPWLVGIIAVAVFLVVAFVFLLFNHYVCEKFYERDEDFPEDELESTGKVERDEDFPEVELESTGKVPENDYAEVVKITPALGRRRENEYENGAYVEETTEL